MEFYAVILIWQKYSDILLVHGFLSCNIWEDDRFWDILPWSLIKAEVNQRCIISTLMVKAVCTSETLVNFWKTTWLSISERCHLHTCCYEISHVRNVSLFPDWTDRHGLSGILTCEPVCGLGLRVCLLSPTCLCPCLLTSMLDLRRPNSRAFNVLCNSYGNNETETTVTEECGRTC